MVKNMLMPTSVSRIYYWMYIYFKGSFHASFSTNLSMIIEEDKIFRYDANNQDEKNLDTWQKSRGETNHRLSYSDFTIF